MAKTAGQRAKWAAYMRQWYRNNPGKSTAANRRWRTKNIEKSRAIKQAWKRRNRQKENANQALEYAVKTGKVIRPDMCQKCSVLCKPEAHHADYSKPFEVEWLCTPCHGKTRRK